MPKESNFLHGNLLLKVELWSIEGPAWSRISWRSCLKQNFSCWRPCSSFLSRNDDAGMATKKLGEENWRIWSEKSWVQVWNILSLKCTEHFNFEYGYQCCLYEFQGYMSRILAQPLVINMIQLWRKLVSGLLSLQDWKFFLKLCNIKFITSHCCMLIFCGLVLQSMLMLYSTSLVIWYYTLAQNNSNVSTDDL